MSQKKKTVPEKRTIFDAFSKVTPSKPTQDPQHSTKNIIKSVNRDEISKKLFSDDMSDHNPYDIIDDKLKALKSNSFLPHVNISFSDMSPTPSFVDSEIEKNDQTSLKVLPPVNSTNLLDTSNKSPPNESSVNVSTCNYTSRPLSQTQFALSQHLSLHSVSSTSSRLRNHSQTSQNNPPYSGTSNTNVYNNVSFSSDRFTPSSFLSTPLEHSQFSIRNSNTNSQAFSQIGLSNNSNSTQIMPFSSLQNLNKTSGNSGNSDLCSYPLTPNSRPHSFTLQGKEKENSLSYVPPPNPISSVDSSLAVEHTAKKPKFADSLSKSVDVDLNLASGTSVNSKHPKSSSTSSDKPSKNKASTKNMKNAKSVDADVQTAVSASSVVSPVVSQQHIDRCITVATRLADYFRRGVLDRGVQYRIDVELGERDDEVLEFVPENPDPQSESFFTYSNPFTLTNTSALRLSDTTLEQLRTFRENTLEQLRIRENVFVSIGNSGMESDMVSSSDMTSPPVFVSVSDKLSVETAETTVCNMLESDQWRLLIARLTQDSSLPLKNLQIQLYWVLFGYSWSSLTSLVGQANKAKDQVEEGTGKEKERDSQKTGKNGKQEMIVSQGSQGNKSGGDNKEQPSQVILGKLSKGNIEGFGASLLTERVLGKIGNAIELLCEYKTYGHNLHLSDLSYNLDVSHVSLSLKPNNEPDNGLPSIDSSSYHTQSSGQTSASQLTSETSSTKTPSSPLLTSLAPNTQIISMPSYCYSVWECRFEHFLQQDYKLIRSNRTKRNFLEHFVRSTIAYINLASKSCVDDSKYDVLEKKLTKCEEKYLDEVAKKKTQLIKAMNEAKLKEEARLWKEREREEREREKEERSRKRQEEIEERQRRKQEESGEKQKMKNEEREKRERERREEENKRQLEEEKRKLRNLSFLGVQVKTVKSGTEPPSALSHAPSSDPTSDTRFRPYRIASNHIPPPRPTVRKYHVSIRSSLYSPERDGGYSKEIFQRDLKLKYGSIQKKRKERRLERKKNSLTKHGETTTNTVITSTSTSTPIPVIDLEKSTVSTSSTASTAPLSLSLVSLTSPPTLSAFADRVKIGEQGLKFFYFDEYSDSNVDATISNSIHSINLFGSWPIGVTGHPLSNLGGSLQEELTSIRYRRPLCRYSDVDYDTEEFMNEETPVDEEGDDVDHDDDEDDYDDDSDDDDGIVKDKGSDKHSSFNQDSKTSDGNFTSVMWVNSSIAKSRFTLDDVVFTKPEVFSKPISNPTIDLSRIVNSTPIVDLLKPFQAMTLTSSQPPLSVSIVKQTKKKKKAKKIRPNISFSTSVACKHNVLPSLPVATITTPTTNTPQSSDIPINVLIPRKKSTNVAQPSSTNITEIKIHTLIPKRKTNPTLATGLSKK